MALPLSSNNSDSNNYAEINRLIKKVESKDRVQIFKDDAGDRRVLLGKGANGFYGLKVSKADKDVYEAPNADLIFNSDQNILKVVTTGEVTIPTVSVTAGNTGGGTTTVAHGLSSVPIVQAYAYTPVATISGGALYNRTAYIQLPCNSSIYGYASFYQNELMVMVDATNIYFCYSYTNPGGSTYVWPAIPIKYYVLQETAN